MAMSAALPAEVRRAWGRFSILLAVFPAAALLEASTASARQIEEPHWHDNAPRFPNPPHTGDSADDERDEALQRRTRRTSRNTPRHAATPPAARRASLHPSGNRRARKAQPGHRTGARAEARRQASRPASRREIEVARAVPALEQRSVLAAHPLLLDPPQEPQPQIIVAFFPEPSRAAPRCRSTHASSFTLAIAAFAADFRPGEPALVEGPWPHCRPPRAPQSTPEPARVKLASLGSPPLGPSPAEAPRLSGGSTIRWIASPRCLAGSLRGVLAQVAANFGPITVNSTCRNPRHNRRVGGAPRSYHLTGNAVDFRISGNPGRVLAFLSRQRGVGGLKHYGRGVFHIDTGPRRTWGARRRIARR
jgi:hypothetical protein